MSRLMAKTNGNARHICQHHDWHYVVEDYPHHDGGDLHFHFAVLPSERREVLLDVPKSEWAISPKSFGILVEMHSPTAIDPSPHTGGIAP